MRLIPRVRRLPHLLAFVTTLLIVMAPVQAGAILPSVGLYGGLTHPLGAEANSWGVHGSVCFALAPFLSFGPEVGLYNYKVDIEQLPYGCPTCPSVNSRVRTYGAVLRFGPPLPMIHPYAIVGLGAYAWKGYDIPDKNLLGMSGGLGLDLGPTLSPLKLSVEGRWHGKATTHATWHGERNFATVMAGVRLSFF